MDAIGQGGRANCGRPQRIFLSLILNAGLDSRLICQLQNSMNKVLKCSSKETGKEIRKCNSVQVKKIVHFNSRALGIVLLTHFFLLNFLQ